MSAASPPEAGRPARDAPLKLSVELRAMEERFRGQSLRLADVFAATRGRAYYVLMIVCCLPFLTPVPAMGLSAPFGMVIFMTALWLTLGRQPWLPRRLLEKQLPPGFLSRLLNVAAKLLRYLEVLLRPRWGFVHATPALERAGTGGIAVAAVLLMLPLPVPFTNTFPAVTILLLSAGALERDGVCSLAGWVMFAAAAGFFLALAFGGAAVFNTLFPGQ